MDETFLMFHRIVCIAGIPFFAKKHWNSNLLLFSQIFNFIISVVCFIFTTAFVATNYSDFLLCIQGACIWNTGVIMTISLGVCLTFRNQFRNFLEEMVFRDAMLDIPMIKNVLLVHHGGERIAELRDMIFGTQEKLFKYASILFKAYLVSVLMCATLYLCSPIYLMIVRRDKSLRLLAFDMWFPWSLENYNVYIASFIFHAYTGYLCCFAVPGLQLTITLLLSQVIRQLRILTFILLHMHELVLELTGVQDETWQANCTWFLSQCVDHYVKIKRFSNRLNDICRPFYLTLILDAIMAVCMCSVKIAISDKFSMETMKYYIHVYCFILMVLLFCLLGQQVENECEELEKAVTEKWYIFNRTHKANLRIFTMALNQRMPIYIFGSITLSLTTFTWFIKTGSSFFTLLMSVLEE